MPDSDRCFCLFCVDFGDFVVIRKEVLVTDVQEQERKRTWVPILAQKKK